MTDEIHELGAELQAAVSVHAARRRVDDAIADLAASPLDEAAAARMREILDSPEMRVARRRLRQLMATRIKFDPAPAKGATILPFRDPNTSVLGGVA